MSSVRRNVRDSITLVGNLIVFQFLTDAINKIVQLALKSFVRLSGTQFATLSDSNHIAIRFDAVNFDQVSVVHTTTTLWTTPLLIIIVSVSHQNIINSHTNDRTNEPPNQKSCHPHASINSLM